MNIHQDKTIGRPIDPAAGRGRSVEERMEAFVSGSTVMLFVKGMPAQPMCGFSATVMDLFNRIGSPYATFNILADPEIRAGAKSFSDWPTFPQIYIGGEFVGGCDIVVQMFQQGELQELVKESIDAKGAGHAHAQQDAIDDATSETQNNNITVPASAKAQGEGLESVRQIRPRKAALMGLESFILIDVRSSHEGEISNLPDGTLIPLDHFEERFNEIPLDANIMLYCRTGGRSNHAGMFLVAQGYRHVWNLDGGLNAWSEEVDTNMSQY